MKRIYEIIEENVDGCGTNASVYVASPDVLNPKEEHTLKECLDEVKSNIPGEDWNTDEMVDEALKQFLNRTGKELNITNSPIHSIITF